MSEQQYGPLADQIARRHGLDPRLFRALITQESGWRVNAGSPAGAQGLAQLMPGTARGLGVRNIRDPRQNLEGGAKYLAQQIKTFGGDIRRGLAAYNAGPGAVSKYGGVPPYAETQGYVKTILSHYGGGGGTSSQSGGAAADPGASLPAPGSPPSGQLDARRLMGILNATRQRVLRGEMPGPNYQSELQKLAAGALPRGMAVQGAKQVGTAAVRAGLTMGGGPEAHHSRALGNWQSDDAYDLMGKAGGVVPAYVSGVVTKISGKPGGDPGFAGYGITVRTKDGDLFFKHLGSANVKVGQRITPQTILGTLDPSTAGGPHLHLGGTNRGQIDRLARFYTARGA